MYEDNKYYKESGKFSPLGAVLITLCTAGLGIALFALYILFNGWCTIIYLNVIAASAAAAVMGFVVSKIARVFKIRNKTVIIICGVIGFLIATYFKWALYDYLDVKKYRYNSMKDSTAENYYALDVYFGYDVDTQMMIDTYKELNEEQFIQLYTGGEFSYSELNFSDEDIEDAKKMTVWEYNDFEKLLGKDADEVEASLEKAKTMDAYEFTFDYRKTEAKKTVLHLMISPKELFDDIKEINRFGRWSLKSSTSSSQNSTSGNDNISGVVLWIVWFAEFLDMGGFFLLLVWGSFNTPFIESEDRWAIHKGYSPKIFYSPDNLNELKSGLELSEFNLFELAVDPNAPKPSKYLQVEVYHSMTMDENYINVYQVTITQKGKNTNTAKKKVINLMRVSKEFVTSDKLF